MAQVGELTGYALLFVITGVLIAVGLYVMSTMGTQLGAVTGQAFGNATSALGTLAGWLPIIAIVVAASVILYLVVTSFGRTGRA